MQIKAAVKALGRMLDVELEVPVGPALQASIVITAPTDGVRKGDTVTGKVVVDGVDAAEVEVLSLTVDGQPVDVAADDSFSFVAA